MSAWQVRLRRGVMRTLAFIVFPFLVVVVLPNNEVGTSDLPAVGARSVLGNADGCSMTPSKGAPAVFVVALGLDGMEYVRQNALVLSPNPANPAADILQLSRRLRI